MGKLFLILGSFSLIRVFIFICFYSKDTFLFSILLDRISLNNFILFSYSAIITLVYSINLILWVFNFGSNTILPIILTYNRLLILLILLVLISFNLFVLNFNFSLFNSFVRKFLPIILLAFVLTKILSFNFSHLNFNIFNISNFHLSLSNKF